MTWRLRWKLRRNINSIRFDLIEAEPPTPTYLQGGEYRALLWLKAYVEGRTSAEPRELLESCLRSMLSDQPYFTAKHQAEYMLTLLPYVE